MRLFDRVATQLERHIADLRDRGEVESRAAAAVSPWPRGQSLVLTEDTALELGNPAVGSLSCVVWSDAAAKADSVVTSSDASFPPGGSLGLAQVVVVSGRFDDDYERYLDLRDALRDLDLEGISARSLPGSQQVWYRVSRVALDSGLTLAHIGEAIVKQVGELPFVDHVTAALIVGRRLQQDPLAALLPLVRESGRIVGALVKRNEEEDKDCEACDFSDLCEETVTP